jgi:hypothetical protein
VRAPTLTTAVFAQRAAFGQESRQASSSRWIQSVSLLRNSCCVWAECNNFSSPCSFTSNLRNLRRSNRHKNRAYRNMVSSFIFSQRELVSCFCGVCFFKKVRSRSQRFDRAAESWLLSRLLALASLHVVLISRSLCCVFACELLVGFFDLSSQSNNV